MDNEMQRTLIEIESKVDGLVNAYNTLSQNVRSMVDGLRGLSESSIEVQRMADVAIEERIAKEEKQEREEHAIKLRDHIAIEVCKILISKISIMESARASSVAYQSYDMADAMILARKRDEE